MKQFMGQDFLLSTPTATALFENYARDLPIIDYHCHINPAEIAEDKKFRNITEAWLYGDHYKWRAIRACGFAEPFVTGNAGDYERFEAWAKTMPKLIGNPLYHWTHLELKRYFGFEKPLDGSTCKQAWECCNQRLTEGGLSVRSILKMSKVKLICTTDDPADDLRDHARIRSVKDFDTKVLPAFRPDKAVNIEKGGFREYIVQTLSPASGIEIQTLTDLLDAFGRRLDVFAANGCVMSDHGMDYVPFAPCTQREADRILRKALDGGVLTVEEADQYKTFLLLFFAREFTRRGWVMQIHYGVTRNRSTEAFRSLGPDMGFDTIAGYDCIRNALSLLDAMEQASALPKMVFYSLNPVENAAIDAMCGCFQGNDSAVQSKIQHGSAWWFNDHLDGMREQMKSYASIGVFSNFIGMLTDSRSFLSYTRHEYFRRILCDFVGGMIERGEYPAELEQAGGIVSDVSFHNANRFFGFGV